MQRFLVFILILFANYILLNAQSQTGIASVRHLAHEGTLTKSGEFFSHDSLVASHRSIPFGSIVRITNLKNQKTVDVRINDRGPFINGLIIDLSEVAGQQIGLSVKSKAKVKLDIIHLEDEFQLNKFDSNLAEDGEFSIKIGSFGEKENATRFARKLFTDYNLKNISMKIDDYNGSPSYNVFIGRFPTRAIAEQYLAQLPENLQNGYVTTFD